MLTRSVAVGFAALRSSPLRTALSTIGVVIGVAALVAVLAIGDGVEQFARDQIDRTTNLQAILVQPVTTRLVDRQRVPRDDYPRFTADDVAALASRLPPETDLGLTLTGTALIERPGEETRAAVITGSLAGGQDVADLDLARGRFFTETEVSDAAPVMVVSAGLHDVTGADLGDTIVLRDEPLTVIGVLQDVDREGFLRSWVPLPLVGRVTVPRDNPQAPTLVIKVADVEEVTATTGAIEAWLAERLGEWQGRAQIVSNRTRVRQAQQGMLIFKILMGTFTGIALLVGGIGIMNVLLASVAERTREIGVRRSTGARARDILMQFLAESVAVTSAGSLVGIALGWTAAFGVAALMRARTQALVYAAATWSTVVVAAAAAIVVGIVFGLYPALRAARLPPIEAIRHE